MDKGDLAPDFELPDEDGVPRKLSELAASGPVVLFFYPAAMTPGCTIESCHFRDMKAEFEAVGAQRVGISADVVEKQKKFSDKHEFDYPLLSDPDGAVATPFGDRLHQLLHAAGAGQRAHGATRRTVGCMPPASHRPAPEAGTPDSPAPSAGRLSRRWPSTPRAPCRRGGSSAPRSG